MLSENLELLLGEFLGENYLLLILCALSVFIVLFLIGGFRK